MEAPTKAHLFLACTLAFALGCPLAASAQSPVIGSCTEEAIRAAAAPNALPFIDRALDWVHRGVPYCQCVTGDGGPYRTDCSGLVAMSWGLPAPGNTTYSYAGGPWNNGLSVQLGSWNDIAIGDATNYGGDPDAGTGHIRLFAGWLDDAHSQYCSIEEYSTGHPAEVRSHWLDTSIYVPIRLAGWAPIYNQPPEGWIDAADCSSVSGWAHDVDVLGSPIAVHLYFDGQAGDPLATGYPTVAGLHRDDVGDHGFAFVVPNGFRDGRDHPVYAYGIDSAGGPNPLLSGSPKVFHCDAPAAPFPDGVRRHVVSDDSMTAWHFGPRDLVAVDAATLARFPPSDDWPAAPAMIAAPGYSGVFLRDVQLGTETRRELPSGGTMDHWHLDAATVETIDRSALASLGAGLAVSEAPYLVVSEGDVYVIDAPPPSLEAPACDAGPTPTPSDGGVAYDAGPRPARIQGGCACTVASGSGGAGGSGAAIAVLLLVTACAWSRRARRSGGCPTPVL